MQNRILKKGTCLTGALLSMLVGFSIAASAVHAQSDVPDGAIPELYNKVPDEYRDGFVTVYDPQYPPGYYIDENGKMVGYALDFQAAIAEKIGIPFREEAAKFEGIISGILSKRYDASYFQDTPERRIKMDLVAFLRSGSSVMVQVGNPHGLDLHELCGHKIGVVTGSKQLIDLLPKLSAECTAKGEPEIEIFGFPGLNEGSLAVKTGRVDGYIGDAPNAAALIRATPGIFEITPTADMTGLSAFSLRKGDPMAEIIYEAAKAIIADGTYGKILADWHLKELAMDSPLFNGE